MTFYRVQGPESSSPGGRAPRGAPMSPVGHQVLDLVSRAFLGPAVDGVGGFLRHRVGQALNVSPKLCLNQVQVGGRHRNALGWEDGHALPQVGDGAPQVLKQVWGQQVDSHSQAESLQQLFLGRPVGGAHQRQQPSRQREGGEEDVVIGPAGHGSVQPGGEVRVPLSQNLHRPRGALTQEEEADQ
ncbi:hypothetical protein EYF80_060022 [Liparis tanakae]|uniref:Uncharacterized protein n=1 Tax=Liparis tanakae TaxID=230148 RepID=A0A4Z2EM19_9TELE|nr:hypothetical protein EYF80_060022 [Liparis tanakae]